VNYILDAGSMIAFLDDEHGAEVVEEVLTQPGSICYAHIFNLAEVYYIYFRRGGIAQAEDALQSALDAGIIVRDENDTAFWKDAASLKGRHAIALPDAFCLRSPGGWAGRWSRRITRSLTRL
jgi:hypothetical protein